MAHQLNRQRRPPAADDVTAEWTGDDSGVAQKVFGQHGAILNRIARTTGVSASTRGTKVLLSGAAEDVARAQRIVEELYALARAGYHVGPEDVSPLAGMHVVPDASASSDAGAKPTSGATAQKVHALFKAGIALPDRKNPILPRSTIQQQYIEAIATHPLVFGIGPAGTGKTYLAMAMAVRSLLTKAVSRIVLCRPAVEAGEKLGFLPGDMLEKVNPYLRPLYDALYDMMDIDRVSSLLERGVIEVAPLAFMRGRTLNASFIILDEAQNTTPQQMKMFLTRLGYDSQAVITGDLTQVDLPQGAASGLAHAAGLLTGVEDIAHCYFSQADVVRHPLVQAIINAYDKEDRHGEE